DLSQRKHFLAVFLIDIRPQHQPDVRNFAEITDPPASGLWKLARFEPVIGKINPGGVLAYGLLVSSHVLGRHIVLSRIVGVGADAARIKPVIKFSVGRRQNAQWLSV